MQTGLSLKLFEHNSFPKDQGSFLPRTPDHALL
jgi:hypothetical protein